MSKQGLDAEQKTTLRSFVALAKAIGFPRGQGSYDGTRGTEPSCRMDWSKSGGHAGGAKLRDVLIAAERHGMTPENATKRHDSPDGSVIGSSNAYVKLDVSGRVVARLAHSTSYGAVAAGNHFYLALTGPSLVATVNVLVSRG